jgi:hypothetical protein
MTGLSTVLLSIGATLCAPAAYFAVLKYPEVFSGKVGDMATYSESYIALQKESNFIMEAAKGAADALARAFAFFNIDGNCKNEEYEQIGNLLAVEFAKLRGHRGVNGITNVYVDVASESLEKIVDGWWSKNLKSNEIYMAVATQRSALQIQIRQSLARDILYNVEIAAKQAAIESLNWALYIAMFGLKSYFVVVLLWIGYLLHAYGVLWRIAGPAALGGLVLAIVALTWITNKSVKSPRKLLASLREQNARGK